MEVSEINESSLSIDTELKADALDPLGFIDSEVGHSSETSRHELGRSYYKLAKIHYDKADLKLSEKYFNRALELTEFPKDVFAMLKINGFLVRIYTELLEQKGAVRAIENSEILVDKLSSILGSLNSEYFYNLGVAKTYRGEFNEAKLNFELAYKKSREENEPDLQAKTLLALGNTYYSLKNFDESLKHFILLEQLLEIIEKSYLKGSMFFSMGKTYVEIGELNRADECLRKALKHFQQKKSWNLQSYILYTQGLINKRLGEYEKSLFYFHTAMELTDKTVFKRLYSLIQMEIQDVNDNSIELYLDRVNRKVVERQIGVIDFKHRFVLLEILFLLAKNPGRYYDKDQLAKEIWRDEYNPLIHDKLIYTSVSRLRKLIEPKNGKHDKRKYIIRGKDGYTFNPRAKIRFHLEGQPESFSNLGNIDLNVPV
jgi:tetratricopeptide (TPR) repeat protein